MPWKLSAQIDSMIQAVDCISFAVRCKVVETCVLVFLDTICQGRTTWIIVSPAVRVLLTNRQQSGDRGRIPEAETGSLQQESKNVVVDNNFVG